MSSVARWLLVPALLVGWLGFVRPAAALTPMVRDDAGFFSKDAVGKANEQIRDIKTKHKLDLVVETFATPPSDRAEEVKKMSKEAKATFFDRWAKDRARQEGVDGIYVLITRNPGHVQVEVENRIEKMLPGGERGKLRDLLLDKFKQKQYDTGLLEVVDNVHTALNANPRRGAAPAPPPVAGGAGHMGGQRQPAFGLGSLLCVGLVIVGVIWLLFAVIRGIAGAGRSGAAGGAPGYGGYGGGGGGFMSGMLGGLFGAAAGSWLYDSMFRGGSSHQGDWGGSSASGGDTGAVGGDDRDYSGSGGDFDDTSGGGGDFGGSDAGGGGDFGGGDFGGGDFGGGGGDF